MCNDGSSTIIPPFNSRSNTQRDPRQVAARFIVSVTHCQYVRSRQENIESSVHILFRQHPVTAEEGLEGGRGIRGGGRGEHGSADGRCVSEGKRGIRSKGKEKEVKKREGRQIKVYVTDALGENWEQDERKGRREV